MLTSAPLIHLAGAVGKNKLPSMLHYTVTNMLSNELGIDVIKNCTIWDKRAVLGHKLQEV